MSDDRLAHLQSVGPMLWPPPVELRLGRAGSAPDDVHREYLVLPNRRRPRLLVPHGRRAATGALLRYGVGRGRASSWAAAGLAAGMATGAARLVLRDRMWLTAPAGAAVASIETRLAEVLGAEVALSMHLSAPRANRKPVLQVLSRDGRTLAFAKVGIDPLTRGLVRAEAEALRTLAVAGLLRTTVPELLHSETWNGLELLVQSALPVARHRRRPPAAMVAEAQQELSQVGRTAAEPLAQSVYWKALSARIEALPRRAAVEELALLQAATEQRYASVPLALGAWHGDWTPWNTAFDGERLLVWDWERFDPSAPVGFDAVHWALQTDLVSRRADPRASAAACLADAPALLTPWGLDEEQSSATAAAYLVELGTRYLADRQDEAGARLGDVHAWLLPALHDHLAG